MAAAALAVAQHDEITGFAADWVSAWRALGGIIYRDRQGRGRLWYPIPERDHAPATGSGLPRLSYNERLLARRALMLTYDEAGDEMRRAVFDIASVEA